MANQKARKISDSYMFSSFQKFYSALNNINRFRLENNSFENTSYLDNFFSEFRNITFVLQKSIPDGNKNIFYKELSEQYFSSEEMKWFVTKRNDETHIKPTSFIRVFNIEVYGFSSIITKQSIFYDENDHPQQDINKAIILLLEPIQETVEINFSVKHMITETANPKVKDMLVLIRNGIRTMWAFLDLMRNKLEDNSPNLQRIEGEIKKLLPLALNSDLIFTLDCTYDVKEEMIKTATRGMAFFDFENKKQQLKSMNFSFLDQSPNIDSDIELYNYFVLLHLSMYFSGCRDLMSTFFIIFKDKTFILHSFFSSQRSTTYRMINEIANMIREENIRAVIFLWEGLQYDEGQYSSLVNQTYDNRKKHAKNDIVNIELISSKKIRSLSFNPEQLSDQSYLSSILNKDKENQTSLFLYPIVDAFKELEKSVR